MATASSRSRLRVLLAIVTAVAAIAYPLVVYLGLTRVGTRGAAAGLCALSTIHTVVQSRAQGRIAWRSALALPLCAAALWLDDRRYVLAMPVVINTALFSVFFGSLGREHTPICERFARMQVKDLTPEEVVYCRQITKLWSGFFVLNGGIALGLAAAGALDLWTLYTGLISYILIGIVAGSEYTVRKYRFGRYGDGLHDRLLRAILPTSARSTPP
ncbi:MAG: hypothetical protein ABW321_24775 [Polyangiales bacterium]